MRRGITAPAIVIAFIGFWLAHEAAAKPTADYAVPSAGIDKNGFADTPSTTRGDTQLTSPRVTAAQIDRLVAIEKMQASDPSNSGSAASANACVERYMRALDPNNRDWNSSDPRWGKMRDVISEDCQSIVEGYKRKVAPAIQNAYSEAIGKSYKKHLGSKDANTLIRFYESDAGQRYLALQEALTAASNSGMNQFFTGKAVHDSQASTPAAMRARIQLLRLSKTFSIFIVASEDARKAGGDTSGGPAIAIMMHVVAESQGQILDRLEDEYSADLPIYTSFATSPPELDELRALYEATNVANAAAGKVAAEFSPELNGNLNKWRQLYRSLSSDK